jgi:hypothetical protein
MLYQQDFLAWTRQQAHLLSQKRWQDLDLENLIEELEEMGRSNHRELESRLIVLIAHLLKWEFQWKQLQSQWREFEGKSWRNTIIEQRIQIDGLLKDRPSLKNSFEECLQKAYPQAIKLATKETGLSHKTLPNSCPYSMEQLFDEDFLPECR